MIHYSYLASAYNKELNGSLFEGSPVKYRFCPPVFCISLGIIFRIWTSPIQTFQFRFQDSLLLFMFSSWKLIQFDLRDLSYFTF